MPDFGRRDFGRHDSAGGDPSLDAIARTDRLLDALAAGRPIASNDPGDRAIAALMGSWRDEVRWPPSTGLVSEHEAAAALGDGLHELSTGRGKPRRGLALVGSIAAATLVIGGFGAVVAGSEPGDAMYSLRTTLFGEPQSVRDDKVTLAAQTEMAQVQQLINQGDWDQAQQKLQAVTTSVQQVENVDDKTNLIQQWNELSMKVGTRDPNATVPPVNPGEPAAPPPPGVTLLELPPVTASTTSGTSSSSTSPSSTTTTDQTAPSSPSDTVSSGPPTPTSSETTASSPAPEPGQATPTSSAVPPVSTPSPVSESPAVPPSSGVPPASPVSPVPPVSAVPPASPAPAESVPPSAPAIAGSVPPVTTTTTLPPQPPSQAVITPSAAQAPGGGGGSSHSGGGAESSQPVVTAQVPVQQAPNVVVTTPVMPPRPVIQLPIPGFG